MKKNKAVNKILLINPYYSQPKEYYTFYGPPTPMGLMYLAAYLSKFGLESKIVELGVFDIKDAIVTKDRVRFGLSDKRIIEIIKKEKPKVIGITSMYSVYFRDVLEIARLIKKVDHTIKIILGGNHSSSYYSYILRDKNIDFVVIGEGEESFLQLCQAIFKKKNSAEVDGIAFKKGTTVVRTKSRPVIKNLDTIPFPARHLIDFKRYLVQAHHSPFLMRYPAVGMVTSRGCPGNCVYCTVKAVWGRTWRGTSPKKVVDEIELLIKNYGIREIAFLDDSASLDKQRWNEICDEIIERKINIKWTTPNGIAHWTLDKPTLLKMYQAGCYRITFGIESGDLKTRQFLGKPYPLKQAEELLKYANKIGMWTICTNIIGFPYEKRRSIRKTIDFAKKCGTDFACFYMLLPQPTSDVYNYFRKEKLLNFDDFFEGLKMDEDQFEKINHLLNETGCDTKYVKKEELKILQRQAYREFIIHKMFFFLLHPWILFAKIHNFEDFRYTFRLLEQGLKIVIRTLNPRRDKSGDFLYRKVELNK